VPAPTKQSGRRRPLVLEALEDRFAPAAVLQQTFLPPPAFASQTSGHFGTSTATDSNTNVVGMPYANVGRFVDSGAAFVYSTTTGALIATLEDPTPQTDDDFGSSVAVSGNLIVIGAPQHITGGIVCGRGYVFNATTGALVTTLANPSPSSGDDFGLKVAILGNTAVVGCPTTAAGVASRAYMFDATTGALLATLSEPEAAVSVSGNTVVVGNAGSYTPPISGQTYLFNASTGALMLTLVDPSAGSSVGSDGFGYAVSVSGNTVVVGAPWDDTVATDSGQAYVFNATTGALIATLANPAPQAGAWFGARVSASGNTVVVSSSHAASSSGQVYVFDATTGALIDTLASPAPTAGDNFGNGLSVSGSTVIVGASNDDTQNVDQGAAYVYQLDVGSPSQPVVTSVTPSTGPTTGGTTVVINGTNFLGATGVKFGANDATSFTINSATKITAILPPGNGLVNVTVSNSLFTSPTAGTADDFRYTSTATAAVSFILSGPISIGANTSFSMTVIALDAYGNIATGYIGAVRFTDSGKGGTLPANYKFSAADKGVHTFTGIRLKQTGQHTITVIDTTNGSIVGAWSINVA
jgi:outer membrane protein assembly factor BamB